MQAQPEPGILPQWVVLNPRALRMRETMKLAPAPGSDAPRELQVALYRLLPLYVQSLVLSACEVEVDVTVIGRDTCLRIAPMPASAAQEALGTLLQYWRQGLQQPLPLPRDTALALLLKDEEAAQKAFEGDSSSRGAPPDGKDPYWRRLFDSFESLAADGQLQALAEDLYAPMIDWACRYVTDVAWSHSLNSNSHEHSPYPGSAQLSTVR